MADRSFVGVSSSVEVDGTDFLDPAMPLFTSGFRINWTEGGRYKHACAIYLLGRSEVARAAPSYLSTTAILLRR